MAGLKVLFAYVHILARHKGLLAYVYCFGRAEMVICIRVWFSRIRKSYSHLLEQSFYSNGGLRRKRKQGPGEIL